MRDDVGDKDVHAEEVDEDGGEEYDDKAKVAQRLKLTEIGIAVIAAIGVIARAKSTQIGCSSLVVPCSSRTVPPRRTAAATSS